MHLNHLHLEQFRCFVRMELKIPAAGMRLSGANASGKTSLMEAIQLLSTMKSARASVERELINWTSNQDLGLPPYARIIGELSREGESRQIEIGLSVDPQRGSHTRKQIRIDSQNKRAIDAVGLLKTVLFEPEDMELVLGSPSVRRRYLDMALSSTSATYLRALSQYNRIVEQRNSLLKSLREQEGVGRNPSGELEYWDQELVRKAAHIVNARIRFIGELQEPLGRAFRHLIGAQHDLSVGYKPAADSLEGLPGRILEEDETNAQRIVAQSLETALRERRREEVARGVTVVGPHRDDLQLLLDGRDLSAFGSRGQQRLSVVSLKLAQVEVLTGEAGDAPVLLLDDVLSELDISKQALLLEWLSEVGAQVIVSATDASLLDQPPLRHLPLFKVADGDLTMINGQHTDRD